MSICFIEGQARDSRGKSPIELGDWLKSVARIQMDVFLINTSKDMASITELHFSALFDSYCLIVSQFIVKDMHQPNFILKPDSHVVPTRVHSTGVQSSLILHALLSVFIHSKEHSRQLLLSSIVVPNSNCEILFGTSHNNGSLNRNINASDLA